jgi:Heparinase II/III-like protein/Heparinase II/III N-terminus
MNLQTLRDEPLPMLIREAGWRAIRSMRKSIFPVTTARANCRQRFRPIGYYDWQTPLLSSDERAAVLSYADAVLRGEYPLMGHGSPHLGSRPDWHCDWVSQKTWPIEDSRKIRIVRHDGSDVKAPWELSRLQWSPVVAKAYLVSGERKYREAIQSLLTDWIANNPPGLGVNWTVAMEAALRGISLCLTMELLWPFTDDEQAWLEQMTASLWQHLRFIEAHNEFSFLLRSNHYLSNIVGLLTLSSYLGLRRRREKYARAVQRELLLQTNADGGDCEASTGYHFLVAQLGLHAFVVQQQSSVAMAPEFQARLGKMFSWIASLADGSGKLPHLGDCDNGRVELLMDDIAQSSLPAGKRHSLRVGTLSKLASHLLPHQKPVSVLPESGIAILRRNEASIVFCAMPNGLRGKGSHSHCDKLSIIFRLGPDEIFCDTGSRCYTRSAERRNLDRSTRVHNTLMIDEAEQNIFSLDPRLLFQSGNEAAVSQITTFEGGVRASHHGYSRIGIEHRRTVELGDGWLLVVDEVSGDEASGTGEHLLDLRFVLGPEWHVSSEKTTGETVSCIIEGPRRLTLTCETAQLLTLSVIPTEISREYGAGLSTNCLKIQTAARLPAKVQTRVTWD